MYAIAAEAARAAHQAVRYLPTRKDQALAVQARHAAIADLVFGLLDGHDIGPRIWKRLRPVYARPAIAARLEM